MALRDYLPLHIYHHAATHLFDSDELSTATLMPEYTNLRAYTAGNIEVGPGAPCWQAAPCRLGEGFLRMHG